VSGIVDIDVHPTRENSALLTVYVPYRAKVTLNGLETRSKGSRRRYVACGLKPGLNYKYVIEARLVREGQIIEDSKTVVVSAGIDGAAAFAFNPTPCETRSDLKFDPLPAIPEFEPLDVDSLPGIPLEPLVPESKLPSELEPSTIPSLPLESE
jgi:uncharacterized protein (TIGR03000 family)